MEPQKHHWSQPGKRTAWQARQACKPNPYPLIGLAALIWFLVRVIPKPSRATYPCQRVAAPLASGFVLWLLGTSGSALAFRRLKHLKRRRYLTVVLCIVVGVIGIGWAVLSLQKPIYAGHAPHAPNQPLGTARGLWPGRVIWVHNPDVTDWPGPDSGEAWYHHVDQTVADDLLSQALQGYAGQDTDAGAWDAIFAHFNGDAGYWPGSPGQPETAEKIMIKINLTTANAGSGSACADAEYNWRQGTGCGGVSADATANAPQLLLALLDQLVNVVGVPQEAITIGDPTGLFVNFLHNPLYERFPNVHYLDNRGTLGRTRAEFTDPCVPHYWSTSAADGMTQDCVLEAYDAATYIINFAVLKTHNGAGITVNAKNHFGSMLRTPTGMVRGVPSGYFNLHDQLPGDCCRSDDSMTELGQYRPLVDLMGLEPIGGKTLLYLVDGIFGGHDWNSEPARWQMAPFNDDWPSSLFLSMDPVAIDSVAFDFLAEEWKSWPADEQYPLMYEGVQDYLHEAAEADQPDSGTFYDPERDGTAMASLGVHEHWNDSAHKQYTRNLGTGNGIELVLVSRRSMPLLTGWNLVAPNVVTEPPITAQAAQIEIEAQGGNAPEVYRWVSERDIWHGHVQDLPFHSFDLELGQGYFVRATVPNTWQRSGSPPAAPVPVALHPVWTLIGLPKMPGPMAASDILSDANAQGSACTQVARWDASVSDWQIHSAGLPGSDFALTGGEGYFLACANAITYTPGAGGALQQQALTLAPPVAAEVLEPADDPAISDLLVTNRRDVAFSITWRTDQPSTGWVEYGEKTALGQTAHDDKGAGAVSQVHHVTLIGLTPETTYYFRVHSGETVDNNDGDLYQLTTKATELPPVPFLAYGQILTPDKKPAVGALVRAWLVDEAGNEAEPLSALVDGYGYWSLNLSSGMDLPVQECKGLYLRLEVVGHGGGEAEIIQPACEVQPVATIELPAKSPTGETMELYLPLILRQAP